jgi:hypothetical protein
MSWIEEKRNAGTFPQGQELGRSANVRFSRAVEQPGLCFFVLKLNRPRVSPIVAALQRRGVELVWLRFCRARRSVVSTQQIGR